jgi:hypothetical protein
MSLVNDSTPGQAQPRAGLIGEEYRLQMHTHAASIPVEEAPRQPREATRG